MSYYYYSEIFKVSRITIVNTETSDSVPGQCGETLLDIKLRD
jgi:hypothetical protein